MSKTFKDSNLGASVSNPGPNPNHLQTTTTTTTDTHSHNSKKVVFVDTCTLKDVFRFSSNQDLYNHFLHICSRKHDTSVGSRPIVRIVQQRSVAFKLVLNSFVAVMKLCEWDQGLLFLKQITNVYVANRKRIRSFKSSYLKANPAQIKLNVVFPCYLWVGADKVWSYKIGRLLYIKKSLSDTSAWLSTLGGAYATLGQKNKTMALKAGEMAGHQLKLALYSGNPISVCECMLFLAYSYMHQGDYNRAACIILEQYNLAVSQLSFSRTLPQQCEFAWKKLGQAISSSSIQPN